MDQATTEPRLRDQVSELLRGVRENDLLTFASAIAFQTLTAVIPLALFAIALLGALDLQETWRGDLAPKLEESVSKAAYELVNDAVLRVFDRGQVFWLSLGGLLTLWQLSGGVRAVMDVADRIYGGGRRSGIVRRYAVSLSLSLPVAALILLAAAALEFGAKLLSLDGGGLTAVASFVVSYGSAAILLFLAVVLLVRFAPSSAPPLRWVAFGSLLTVVMWLIASTVFALYVTRVADYGSVFGSLAAVFVALVYVYVSAVAFLLGLQLDAMVRKKSEGTAHGN